jgi:hypothetical protein
VTRGHRSRAALLTGLLALLTAWTSASGGAVNSSGGGTQRSAASAARTRSAATTPSARVGAFYFDGWSGTLGNFHWGGLLGTEFSNRQPLSGWTDDRPEAIEAQLRWAHADGISFFAFDWYYNPDSGNGPINMAHDTYLKLHDHYGVGFALNYVNQDAFVIPPDQWAAAADKWVTEDFLNPDYVRIDGKPLLVILDEHAFNVQMGGAAGVNATIATLQEAARRHGLPGVFVVGGRYLDWRSEQCFPHCLDTDLDFAQEHYDAITEFTYPQILEPRDGPRPYPEVAAAIERAWDVIAQRSPFPHIPSVMAGLDARPMILAGQIQAAEQGGWPLLNGHKTWFETTPADVGGLVHDATAWVQAHPSMRVEPAPAPPVVLIQSWNELQEGAILVPTEKDVYSYGQAIAQAVGIPWTAPPKHTLQVRSSTTAGTVTSTPSGVACPPGCTASFDEGLEITLTAAPTRGFVLDGWTSCTAEGASCSLVLVADSKARPVLSKALQRRAVTLRVAGHHSARGHLRVLDGYAACASDETVQIQRRHGSSWTTLVSTQTNQVGAYSVRVPNHSATYRSHTPRSSLGEHTCLTASSQPIASR